MITDHAGRPVGGKLRAGTNEATLHSICIVWAQLRQVLEYIGLRAEHRNIQMERHDITQHSQSISRFKNPININIIFNYLALLFIYFFFRDCYLFYIK